MTKENRKGFTIIEVVLVLAIAGLIFLMVFVALPSLQRGQRNTERENNLSRISSAITDYQSNNSGNMPWREGAGAMQTFIQRYVDSKAEFTNNTDTMASSAGAEFTDPDGSYMGWELHTNVTVASGEATAPTGLNATEPDYKVHIYPGFSCAGSEGRISPNGGNRTFALVYIQEGGAEYCLDNH